MQTFRFILAGVAATWSCGAPNAQARPWQARDTIELTYFARDFSYPQSFTPSNLSGVLTSPDGRRSLVIARRGNLNADSNDYQLRIYNHHVIGRSQNRAGADLAVEHVVSFSSTSAAPGISQPVWISNSAIAFLAADGPAHPQLFRYDLKTRILDKLTSLPFGVAAFATSGSTWIAFGDQSRTELAVPQSYPGTYLTDFVPIMSPGRYNAISGLFVSVDGAAPRVLGSRKGPALPGTGLLSIAPGGRFALIGDALPMANPVTTPPAERQCGAVPFHVLSLRDDNQAGRASSVLRGQARIVGAPAWSSDGSAVLYLEAGGSRNAGTVSVVSYDLKSCRRRDLYTKAEAERSARSLELVATAADRVILRGEEGSLPQFAYKRAGWRRLGELR